MRSTGRFQALLAGTLLLFALAVLFAAPAAAFLASGLLAFLLHERWRFSRLLSGLALSVERRILTETLHAGDDVELELVVLHDAPMRVTVRERPPSSLVSPSVSFPAPPGETSHRYVALASERGPLSFSSVAADVEDASRLFGATLSVPCRTDATVLASREAFSRAQALAQRERLLLRRQSAIGTNPDQEDYEFSRPYVAGDRFRDIDWKATSRLLTLITRQFEKHRPMSVAVLLDASRSMRSGFEGGTRLDHAVALALQLSTVLLRNRHEVSLAVWDEFGVRERVAPGRGPPQEERVAAALRDLPGRLASSSEAPPAEGGAPSDEVLGFLRTVQPFLGGPAPLLQRPAEASGLHQAVVGSTSAGAGPNQALIVLTDLEASPETLRANLALARKRSAGVYVLAPFPPSYGGAAQVTPETLEALYPAAARRDRLVRGLRALGLAVYEADPWTPPEEIVESVRRWGGV